MLSRPLSDLSEQDLQSLVTNEVAEARDLEFKRDLPGGADADTKEFLGDVTSLANAQGGDLIIGVEEREGMASAIVGIEATDIDGTILRLENIVRTGIEPRLGIKVRWIPIADGRGVIVMRIPASLAAPHRISFKNSGKFLSRNSKGKYEMDVHELRTAFTESEALPARLRQFHEAAVLNAQGVDMPFNVGSDPTAVFSLMPLGLLRERRDLVLNPTSVAYPVSESGSACLHTLEGILWYTPPTANNIVSSYALTHRTGRVDASWTFGGMRQPDGGKTVLLAFSKRFEHGVMYMAANGIDCLRKYGVEGPWLISVTVLKLKGATISQNYGYSSRAAWRESAHLPELILDDITDDSLLPIFKSFWLLFGETRPE